MQDLCGVDLIGDKTGLIMRENLLKYCGLDTFAMVVKVLKKLKEIAGI